MCDHFNVSPGLVKGVSSATHLVPVVKSGDAGPWAVFKRIGRLAHQDLLGGVGVVVRPWQQQIPLRYAQHVGFSPHTFKPIGLHHRVQLSFLDEVSNVIETGDGCVLEEGGSRNLLVNSCCCSI